MKLAIITVAAMMAAVSSWAWAKNDTKGMTRLVRLNVAVMGSHGNAAPELKADDLEVFDNGKEQKIELFRRNGAKEDGPGLVLRAGEVTNRAGNTPGQVTVILFDLLNTHIEDQGYVRGQLVQALNKAEKTDSLYLYLLTIKGLEGVHGLPAPGEAARTTAWTANVGAKLDEAMQGVNRLGPQNDNMMPWDRVTATYKALGTLLDEMGGITGRKNLVWVTRGVPLEIGGQHPDWGTPANFEPLLRQLSGQLDASGVAVYAVEAFGAGREASSSVLQEVQTLDELAGMTGGKVYGDGDVGAALEDAAAAARSSYVAGYYPPPGNWNGKLHKIKLKCSLKDVKLQAKTQYMAYPLEASGGAEEQAAVRTAAESAVDTEEIGLAGTAGPDAKEPGKTSIRVRIRAQDIILLEGGGKYRGEVSLTYVAYGAGGQKIMSRPLPAPIELTEAQREQAMKDGIVEGHDIGFGPSVEKVRVIVFDNYSDAVGSVTLGLTGGKAGG
jgi:VWFA-related protein